MQTLEDFIAGHIIYYDIQNARLANLLDVTPNYCILMFITTKLD